MSQFPGILHKYSEAKVAFEFTPTKLPNAFIIIGGMTDGLLTVPYATGLPNVLEKFGYSVIQIQMSSSFKGYGMVSLKSDVEEIKQLIDYLKSREGGYKNKIVIMGHSTGSQDVIQYMLNYGDNIDGGIMQAGVSDREAAQNEILPDTLKRLNAYAENLVKSGKGDSILPSEYSLCMGGVAFTAYRWCSLMIKGGDDDYFSSDLPFDTFHNSFGRLNKPFLVAYSEEDEFVPDNVDKVALIRMFQSASNPKYWSRYSGLIKNASHGVSESEAQQYLFMMITGFMKEFNL